MESELALDVFITLERKRFFLLEPRTFLHLSTFLKARAHASSEYERGSTCFTRSSASSRLVIG
ncbi:hypothetical protein BpHYR1_011054 [Brachionus plicatilis]|uniref:Uncharacterized protein n=1 Tax=Brachionus plicatilis TaxID=10195 RepID=A0A3M7PMS9_BRAPC|nr:hypothetical protein BpHYR1_011054 [Brachionus plicatilis]